MRIIVDRREFLSLSVPVRDDITYVIHCSAGNIRPAPHLNAAEKQKKSYTCSVYIGSW